MISELIFSWLGLFNSDLKFPIFLINSDFKGFIRTYNWSESFI